jgi:hypothetical protein
MLRNGKWQIVGAEDLIAPGQLEKPYVRSMHGYEGRPRKDHRGVDLISDILPIGRWWYRRAGCRSPTQSATRSSTAGHMMPCASRLPPGEMVWEEEIRKRNR